MSGITTSCRWRMNPWAVGLILCIAPAAWAEDVSSPTDPLPAEAGDFSLSFEGSVAIPLTSPQSNHFDVGGGETITPRWNLDGFHLGPTVGFLALPSQGGTLDPGTAWTLGGSLRLKRPHDTPDTDTFYNLSPWAEVDPLYVRTGDLDRPGFSAALGVAMPIGRSRTFWIGPFIQYLEIPAQHRRVRRSLTPRSSALESAWRWAEASPAHRPSQPRSPRRSQRRRRSLRSRALSARICVRRSWSNPRSSSCGSGSTSR